MNANTVIHPEQGERLLWGDFVPPKPPSKYWRWLELALYGLGLFTFLYDLPDLLQVENLRFIVLTVILSFLVFRIVQWLWPKRHVITKRFTPPQFIARWLSEQRLVIAGHNGEVALSRTTLKSLENVFSEGSPALHLQTKDGVFVVTSHDLDGLEKALRGAWGI